MHLYLVVQLYDLYYIYICMCFYNEWHFYKTELLLLQVCR